ncbi:type IV pilus assembly protein PilX [Pseudomonas sp. UC 17F4]|uniref:PilX N-terminal domain-containing pilus assembly protein n=1 Tax=Pseudomonas sp. UC 17F4 TaxID=1855328 RepID=UPI00088D8FD9|nr:PilX N-terminal domain-containing pilus assembly protein [Pseudomonas sp. UC 17F4]SDQ38053.1 type IV pilus assembly protein PilX [Pseudomonas sp. UC 17F4]
MARPGSQRGVVLLVSLVLLGLLALLGVSAMVSATLQRRMAGNLQAALHGLEQAEQALLLGESTVVGVLPCSYCLPPPEAARVRAPGVYRGEGPTSGLSWQGGASGFHLVQNLGQSTHAAHWPANLSVTLYRITAVSHAWVGRSVLESVYAQAVEEGAQPPRRILWRQLH